MARLGMINSPDRREVLTTLEEFLAQYVEAKELGVDEEDVRNQMAASCGLNVVEFTQMLYDQGVEEQRKGTKGLTKCGWAPGGRCEGFGKHDASKQAQFGSVGPTRHLFK